MSAQAALFLDRDGIINHDPGDYICKAEDWMLLKGILTVMQAYQARGYLLMVVTNQGGIALGRYQESDLDLIHRKMHAELGAHGIHLDAVYYCPHHPHVEPCLCRKPASLMVRKAVHRFGLDPERCLMIGDRERDVEAARGAGVPGYLVETNRDLREVPGPWQKFLLCLLLWCSCFGIPPKFSRAQTVTALVYLDPDCSHTKQVLPALAANQMRWGSQVHWMAVFSDSTRPEMDCLRYLLEHNLAMALRRENLQQSIRIYGIPMQPWILIRDTRSRTLYQGPLRELPSGQRPVRPARWERELQHALESQSGKITTKGNPSGSGPAKSGPSGTGPAKSGPSGTGPSRSTSSAAPPPTKQNHPQGLGCKVP
jgi:D-glycero-D-manno-heptose 1,7-bisphosphate phosphatase